MGAGLQGGDARETVTFTLLLCDERGEPIRPPAGHSARNLNENVDAWSDLDNFNVHAHLVSSSSKNIIDVAAQRPTPTGAVVCTYSVPEKGNYTLNVTVNGEHAQGSPTPLFFGPPAKDETTAKLGDNNATETPAAAAAAAVSRLGRGDNDGNNSSSTTTNHQHSHSHSHSHDVADGKHRSHGPIDKLAGDGYRGGCEQHRLAVWHGHVTSNTRTWQRKSRVRHSCHGFGGGGGAPRNQFRSCSQNCGHHRRGCISCC
ncbi:RRM domain-containing protein [Pycnococcus provasolii]